MIKESKRMKIHLWPIFSGLILFLLKSIRQYLLLPVGGLYTKINLKPQVMSLLLSPGLLFESYSIGCFANTADVQIYGARYGMKSILGLALCYSAK